MTGRLRGFDGLRAIAAVSIVGLHASAVTRASIRGPLSEYLARLDVGVAIFFVISGFLLYRPFARAHLDASEPVDVRRFYVRRALRIYPAYWIALTAVIIAFQNARIDGLMQYVLHYGLVQIYTPKLVAGIIPAWTLAVEVSFYAALPLYALLLGRIGRSLQPARRAHVELAGAALVYGGALVARAALGAASGTDTFRLKWLPFMADWFALGIALAVAKVAFDAGLLAGAGARLVRSVDRAPVLAVAVAAAAFVAVANIGLHTTFDVESVARDVARQVLYGATAVALVAAAAWRSETDDTRRRLDAVPLVALGTISYGIFLWHYDVIAQLERWDVEPTTVGLFLLALAVAAVFATVSWHLVERPLLRGRDGQRRRSASRRELA
jgi:peptidoglycan/LPS O-acetylase OafA/YrhL